MGRDALSSHMLMGVDDGGKGVLEWRLLGSRTPRASPLLPQQLLLQRLLGPQASHLPPPTTLP